MGYYVRSLRWKKSAPKWKIQFLSYKKSDALDSKAKKPKKEWDIPPDRWRTLGFHQSMSIDDANVRARQLNAQSLLKRQEERVRKFELERRQELVRNNAELPIEFVTEFEQRFIRIRDTEVARGKRRTSRVHTVWQAAQRMIVTLQIEPSEWFYATHEIYDYFHERQYSMRYMTAILNIANLWGFFISKKLARPFLPIPRPRGYERQRLLEAYYAKTTNVSLNATKNPA